MLSIILGSVGLSSKSSSTSNILGYEIEGLEVGEPRLALERRFGFRLPGVGDGVFMGKFYAGTSDVGFRFPGAV